MHLKDAPTPEAKIPKRVILAARPVRPFQLNYISLTQLPRIKATNLNFLLLPRARRLGPLVEGTTNTDNSRTYLVWKQPIPRPQCERLRIPRRLQRNTCESAQPDRELGSRRPCTTAWCSKNLNFVQTQTPRFANCKPIKSRGMVFLWGRGQGVNGSAERGGVENWKPVFTEALSQFFFSMWSTFFCYSSSSSFLLILIPYVLADRIFFSSQAGFNWSQLKVQCRF